MGEGAFPEDHALALGMAGIWGTRAANETTREADVVLAIGTSFGEADCSSWKPGITFVPEQEHCDEHSIWKSNDS
jgi:acetolactate synthase-1/2/3 large subunit